jgi:hypothetical protein
MLFSPRSACLTQGVTLSTNTFGRVRERRTGGSNSFCEFGKQPSPPSSAESSRRTRRHEKMLLLMLVLRQVATLRGNLETLAIVCGEANGR